MKDASRNGSVQYEDVRYIVNEAEAEAEAEAERKPNAKVFSKKEIADVVSSVLPCAVVVIKDIGEVYSNKHKKTRDELYKLKQHYDVTCFTVAKKDGKIAYKNQCNVVLNDEICLMRLATKEAAKEATEKAKKAKKGGSSLYHHYTTNRHMYIMLRTI